MWKDVMSPVTFVVELNTPKEIIIVPNFFENSVYACQESRWGYRKSFRLKEEAVGQADKIFLCASDSPRLGPRQREERQVRVKGQEAQ